MRKNKSISSDTVIKVVEEVMERSVFEHLHRRYREYNEVRQIAYYCLRKYTNLSLNEIARIFKKNHASILHGVRNIEGFLENDKRMQDIIAKIHSEIIIYMPSAKDYVNTVIEEIETTHIMLEEIKRKFLKIKDKFNIVDDEQLRITEQEDTSVGVV